MCDDIKQYSISQNAFFSIDNDENLISHGRNKSEKLSINVDNIRLCKLSKTLRHNIYGIFEDGTAKMLFCYKNINVNQSVSENFNKCVDSLENINISNEHIDEIFSCRDQEGLIIRCSNKLFYRNDVSCCSIPFLHESGDPAIIKTSFNRKIKSTLSSNKN